MRARLLLLLPVAVLTSACASGSTPEELVTEKLAVSGVTVADPATVTAFLADARASVEHGGYRQVYTFNGEGNLVTVTRTAGRTEILLDGWRLGKANQHVIGAAGSADSVVAHDDDTWEYCVDGACKTFDPLDASALGEAQAKNAEAAVAVLGILPVRPNVVSAVQTYVNAGPTGAAFYTATRAEKDLQATCLVVVRDDDQVLPQMCAYEGSKFDGIPVHRGSRNDGPLNHVIVSTELLN